MRSLSILSICVLLGGCWTWRERTQLELAADACIGGRINTVKRITDTNVAGRLRNTVITTDACLY